jgi:hypothetical protein
VTRRLWKAPLATVALVCLLAGCAKGNPGWQVGDTDTDGAGDAIGDVPGDGIDVGDGADAGVPPREFTCESAGGGRISTDNYTIELFNAPARPVGSTSNGNYTIKLGPAGARSR